MKPEKIKKLRKEKFKLSQIEFAALLGTTQVTLSSWELGKTKPDAYMVEKLNILTKTAHPAEEVLFRTEEEFRKEWGDRILRLRMSLGKSRREFSWILNVSITTSYNWEMKKNTINVESIEKIKKLEEFLR